MRTSIVVAICLWQVLTPSPSPSSAKSVAPQQTAHTNNRTSPMSGTEENTAQHAADTHSAAVKGNENERSIRVVSLPPRSTGDTVALICTVLLTIVGVVGIIVAICTVKTIQKQTKAVLRAVVATKRQTAVMMEAQSGRVAIYWDQIEHIDYGPTRVINGPLVHAFNWYCRNSGQTHLTILKTWSRLIAINSLLDLPEKPDYSAPFERSYIGEELSPGDETRTEWFSAILETALSFEEMQEKHRKRQFVLYAYGYVVYRNVWGGERIHKFGVERAISDGILHDNWLPSGPYAYNRNH
jgi:hypothetical protein